MGELRHDFSVLDWMMCPYSLSCRGVISQNTTFSTTNSKKERKLFWVMSNWHQISIGNEDMYSTCTLGPLHSNFSWGAIIAESQLIQVMVTSLLEGHVL